MQIVFKYFSFITPLLYNKDKLNVFSWVLLDGESSSTDLVRICSLEKGKEAIRNNARHSTELQVVSVWVVREVSDYG